jgi:lysophospholipase L1-like esterase
MTIDNRVVAGAALFVLPFSFFLTARPRAQAQPSFDCAEVARAVVDMMRQDTRLRDWPNLGRYRDDNAALKPPVAPGGGGAPPLRSDARVVFMGDSITDSWDDPRFGGFFPGKPYVNRGISGQTTPQMLLRFRPDVIALRPRAVVILAGTNDIAANTGPMTNDEIAGNLASMAELAKANGVRVVFSSILPVSDYHYKPGTPGGSQTTRRPPERIRALNDWMKGYAATNGHVYLDYWPATADQRGMLKTELSEDDLHPNQKGYDAMGPLAEAAIQRALK